VALGVKEISLQWIHDIFSAGGVGGGKECVKVERNVGFVTQLTARLIPPSS
jgi:hypothetical protein